MPNPPPRFRTGISPPSSRAACSSTMRAADSRKPAVPKICEPMWQCSPTKNSPSVLADARDDLRRILEGEAELLVLVRGGEEVVRLGVHAAVDAHEHRLGGLASLHDRGEAVEFDPAVDHDRADADVDGVLEFHDALVVAVEPQPRGVGSRGQRDGELTARADVDREALVGDPADDLGAQERLARVVDARLHAVRLDRRPEGRERAPGVVAHLVPRRRRTAACRRCRAAPRWRLRRCSGRRPRRGARMPATRSRRARSRRPGAGASPGRARWRRTTRTNRGRVLRRDCCGRARAERECRGSGGLTRRAVPRSLGHAICRTRLP